jgi:cell division protein ZipA
VGLFRWVLILIGILVLALVFAYSRGWFALARSRISAFRGLRRKQDAVKDSEVPGDEQPEGSPDALVEPEPELDLPKLSADSMVVTVRIMPQAGAQFPAEQLILALRAAHLQHGQYGIFHRLDEHDATRIRYSVASLVEPGSFDLNKLKESKYKGISIFMVLPAPEDGVGLFDDMLQTARAVAKEVDGHLLDEQGGALSVQRERYMREEVIDFLRHHQHSANHESD